MQMDYKLSKKINVINQLCTETYFKTKIKSEFNLSRGWLINIKPQWKHFLKSRAAFSLENNVKATRHIWETTDARAQKLRHD